MQLKDGILKYKSVQDYLGVIVTDGGVLKHDITKFIREKRSNVLIKFTNFCSKNFLAPLSVKLGVLDTCVASSMLYASETWMNYGKEVEVIYRNGLRTALGLRTNVNNEIIYTESGKYPLKCRILKQQLKFWLAVQNYCEQSPDSALKHFLDVADEIELPFVNWYKALKNTYVTPENCQRTLEAECRAKWKTSFDEAVDVDSRLGTYVQVNPTLCTPQYINEIMFETDRLLVGHRLHLDDTLYSIQYTHFLFL